MTLGTFWNFAYVCSYLQRNVFAQKRNCAISSKLQIPPRRYNQGHFRKPLQASTNVTKNNYPETTHLFFTIRSIFSYSLRLNYYNFLTALTKLIKLLSFSKQAHSQFTFLQQPSKKQRLFIKFWKLGFSCDVVFEKCKR